MSRIRISMVSLLAVMAVGGIASASASAALKNEYFIKKVAVAAAKAVTGAPGVAVLQGEFATVKTQVECKKGILTEAFIEAAGKSKGKIEFKECTAFELKNGVDTAFPTKCVVGEPITVEYTDQLFGGPGNTEEDRFSPKVGTLFAEVKIENKAPEICPIKVAIKAEGKYVAALGPKGEIEQTEHELVFQSTGSELTSGVGGPKLAYWNTVTGVKVPNNEGWYAD